MLSTWDLFHPSGAAGVVSFCVPSGEGFRFRRWRIEVVPRLSLRRIFREKERPGAPGLSKASARGMSWSEVAGWGSFLVRFLNWVPFFVSFFSPPPLFFPRSSSPQVGRMGPFMKIGVGPIRYKGRVSFLVSRQPKGNRSAVLRIPKSCQWKGFSKTVWFSLTGKSCVCQLISRGLTLTGKPCACQLIRVQIMAGEFVQAQSWVSKGKRLGPLTFPDSACLVNLLPFA